MDPTQNFFLFFDAFSETDRSFASKNFTQFCLQAKVLDKLDNQYLSFLRVKIDKIVTATDQFLGIL
jgi:hypothetical protein